jgi:hypothetical protein
MMEAPMSMIIINGTNSSNTLNGNPTDNNTINGKGGDDIITGGFLADYIDGGSGNDIIYGDQGDSSLNVFIPAGLTISTPPILVVFGNDNIEGGNGNDFISGDQGITTANIIFATSLAINGHTVISDFSLNLSETWGNDTINGGNGNDIVWGDVVAIATNAPTNGSTAIADGTGSHAIANVTINHNVFTFGNDTIDGGNGNDILIGDLTVEGHEPGGGIANATNNGIAESNFYHVNDTNITGSDLIYGGTGDDDIYGDADINSHEIVGGDATADTGGTATTLFSIIGSYQGFASDTLYGNEGNDTIIGDTEIYYNTLTGGTATAHNGGVATSILEVVDTVIDYGNDTINGGVGNDILIGDARSSIIEIEEPGTATQDSGGIASVHVNFINFSQNFGNDVMIGDNGNDIFVGDTLEYELVSDELTSSIVTIGSTNYVRIEDNAGGNNIRWGNDTMTGGNGADKFVWTLFETTAGKVGTQGFDKVTDFDVANDTLAFGHVADRNGDLVVNLSDVIQSTTVTHSSGNTVFTFDGGGSITLMNTNINSLSDIHTQVSAAPIIV